MKHTLLVGVRILSIESLNIIGAKKKVKRSSLLNNGGDSKASRSSVLKIFILGIEVSREMKNTGGHFIMDARA